MFSFFKKKIADQPAADAKSSSSTPAANAAASETTPQQMPAERPRASWMARLSQGLRCTGQSISTVFTGTKIDDDLYE